MEPIKLPQVDEETRERLATEREEWRKLKVQQALAIWRTGKHYYMGTVPHHVKLKRRAKNKVAKRSRKINRGR